MATDLPSAAARVFGIVEIAEKIFLQIDFVGVLKCQRVDKQFNRVIRDSVALQQNLHLAPIPGNPPKELLPVLPQHMTLSKSGDELIVSPLSELRSRIPGKTVNKEAIAYTLASWRKMLVTQPPSQAAIYAHRCKFEDDWRVDHDIGGTVIVGWLPSEADIKLGDVESVANELFEERGIHCEDCIRPWPSMITAFKL
ncbi:Hypothetical predicted protein [Lecanosticta acicola]|uniref:F-box domain-containing protein n=1 Tax=Lecanosticta acicola TaxID=111012 RepID=A0AAI8W1J8_9PEZI|nr:Hypothetical predicted protein [Lecanosticta acicola]